MSFTDRMLTCRDCGKEFTFSAGEQEFYSSRGLMNEPRRCPECRSARRTGDGASRDRGVREMHEVTCSNCGKPAQVPFLPTGTRPVYCADCFQTVRR